MFGRIERGRTLKTRVLVLVDEIEEGTGGAERLAAAIAAALPRERFEAWVCATRSITDEKVKADLQLAGVHVLALGRKRTTDVFKFLRLARLLRRERIDVLHAHMFGSNVWGTLIGRLCRVPLVIAQEHTWSYRGRLFRRLLDGYLIGRLATRFVAVSKLDRTKMIEIEHVPEEKIVVLPTAYIPRPSRLGDLRAELDLPADVKLIGTIAVLRPQKALEVLIDAFAEVRRAHSGARLVLVGDGPSRGELEQRARETAVSESVHFTGTRDDIETALAAFDVAAMSSDFEGMPLFVLECMAHKVPLVATAVGGVPELVSGGETGLLVPPRDPDALAASINRLLDDPEEGRRMATAARERLGEYTLQRAGERFAALYEQLLAERVG